MKKRLIQFALILGLMALTCAAAQATEEPSSGFRNLSVETAYADLVTLTPLTASGGSVAANTDGDYPGAAKLEAVYSQPQSNAEYLLIVLTDTNAPSVDNMAYIDQKTASGAEVTFTIYPKAQTDASVTYHVYMSSNAAGEGTTGVTEYVKVASFEYYGQAAEPEYKLGDVNDDDEIDAGDAVMILEYVVGLVSELDSREQKAANVNHDEDIDAGDAVMILEYVVGIRDNFD